MTCHDTPGTGDVAGGATRTPYPAGRPDRTGGDCPALISAMVHRRIDAAAS